MNSTLKRINVRISFNNKGIFRLCILFGLTTILNINGCNDIYDQEKYKPPDWLAGKLYTQLSGIESLSTFKRCVEITKYDTILDRTGSFTVFAPTDEAFNSWLSSHPEYNGSIENIPLDDLKRIVRIHVIQDAWTLNQLQLLDVDGWIDKNDPDNNKPRAYKRQTLLRDPDTKYWIFNNRGNIVIVDSTRANDYRIVYSRSRKYVPIFFSDFLSLYDLSSADYEFYYDRSFDNGAIHYANSKVLGNEVFAENGFIYRVDRVVDPILNVEQLLCSNEHEEGYHHISELIRLFPSFSADLEETNKQPGAKAGQNFDTLYILDYPQLPFNTHEELTGPNTNDGTYTLRYHNGFLAPDDKAFEIFINDYIMGPSRWNSWNSVPIEVKRIILKNHMTEQPVYYTDILNGFYTGEGDLVKVDEGSINLKYYASNSTFLGLNEVLVPRALTSVSGPVYLRPGFSHLLYAMEYTGVSPAIKKADADYSFFILGDNTLNEDSSLFLVWKDRYRNIYEFTAYDRSAEKDQKMGKRLLAKRILNQIGISTPKGTANKEFIENLAGNYIIFNNTENTVVGGVESTAGYNGGPPVTVSVEELAETADNGKSYRVNAWLLPPNYTMYSALSTRTWFLDLLEKAGMYNNKTYSFNFLTEGESYTIFVPSEQALSDYGADTLSKEDLEKFLKYHFVRGQKIFTDGKKVAGNYSSLRIDESSTPLFTRYSQVSIAPGPDQIGIFDQSGNLLGTVNETEGTTNIMITTDTDKDSNSVFDNITSSVLHEIDFVLHK